MWRKGGKKRLENFGGNMEEKNFKRVQEDSPKPLILLGGRSRYRTADLFRVNDKGRCLPIYLYLLNWRFFQFLQAFIFFFVSLLFHQNTLWYNVFGVYMEYEGGY